MTELWHARGLRAGREWRQLTSPSSHFCWESNFRGRTFWERSSTFEGIFPSLHFDSEILETSDRMKYKLIYIKIPANLHWTSLRTRACNCLIERRENEKERESERAMKVLFVCLGITVESSLVPRTNQIMCDPRPVIHLSKPNPFDTDWALSWYLTILSESIGTGLHRLGHFWRFWSLSRLFTVAIHITKYPYFFVWLLWYWYAED